MYLHYLFSSFCLMVPRFICRNLALSSSKKGVFVRNGSTFVVMKQAFFYFKSFFWTKLIIYKRTKWVDGPRKMLRNILWLLVWLSTLELHRQQGKCQFSSIIITIIVSYAIIRIYTIWYFYFQVSKIEGLAELHWVIKLSVKWGRGSGKGHWWATIVWWAAVDTMWRNLQCLVVVV